MKQVSVSPPERQRPRESRDDRAPEFGTLVPWEQGRLFARLFDDGGQDSGGYGASLNGIKASGDVAMIGALTEQLAPRMLVGSQWPLMAVFHLGRLGRINASIRREQGAGTSSCMQSKTIRCTGSVVYANNVSNGWRRACASLSVCIWQNRRRHDAATFDTSQIQNRYCGCPAALGARVVYAVRGRWVEWRVENGAWYCSCGHPAALLRNRLWRLGLQ